jgi:hypothetical protein
LRQEKNTLKNLIAIFVAMIVVTTAFAAKPILNSNSSSQVALPSCERGSHFSYDKYEMKDGLKAIPKGLLVAREAFFTVESRTDEGKPVTIQSYQSFLNSKKSKAKILCGSADSPLKNRFSMMAPTLIHTNSDRENKNVFWQFQVLAEDTVLSSWNTRSIALQHPGNVEKVLENLGYESQVRQISPKKFAITYKQKSQENTQTLTIVYDFE